MLFRFSLIVFLLLGAKAFALDKITFGTNWIAEPEHGGFYQALADGTYARYGLDVTIMPGGPRTNSRLMLAAGKLDFFMGGNMLEDMSAVQNKIPTLAVAAIFQKDPQILMVHPGQGAERFEDLKNFTLMMSKTLEASIFRWIQVKYGFKAEKLRSYDSNLAPFCADKHVAQQGYVTSEPYTVEKVCGFTPKVFLFADSGYDSYSTLIDTRQDVVDNKPDLVQRFVDASIIGWYHYLYGDNSKANELIKKDNPEMNDERIANSIAKMKEYGIVDSGDAKKLGLGAMTNARQKSFFDKMVKVGFFPAGLDYKKAYTLRFVNKGVGLKSAGN